MLGAARALLLLEIHNPFTSEVVPCWCIIFTLSLLHYIIGRRQHYLHSAPVILENITHIWGQWPFLFWGAYFWRLVTSVLGFKARMDLSLAFRCDWNPKMSVCSNNLSIPARRIVLKFNHKVGYQHWKCCNLWDNCIFCNCIFFYSLLFWLDLCHFGLL